MELIELILTYFSINGEPDKVFVSTEVWRRLCGEASGFYHAMSSPEEGCPQVIGGVPIEIVYDGTQLAFVMKQGER